MPRFCLLFFLFVLAFPARAEMPRMTYIRDAETEHYLRELATPIFYAAKLDPNDINILIIQNPDMNAFVAGGQNIFIYTGLLQASDTPEQLQGVIAHETGHIAGGDLVRGTKAMKNASAQAIIGMIAGLAAGLATGKGDIAAGAIYGSQAMAERSLLSYSRAQESAADSAALRFLDAADVSPSGLLEFMKKLAGQEYLPDENKSEYVRTHPLSQDRLGNISNHIASPTASKKKLPAALKLKHERVLAKLMGYLRPEAALLRYSDKDPRPQARYARAIALYRKSQIEKAMPLVDALLKEEPQNPFFHELKGQILFENGHVDEAVTAYKKAVDILPDSPLLRAAFAHAMLEQKDPAKIDEVIKQLTEANRLETRDPQTWRFLAAAWSRKRETTKDSSYQGLVFYALAEESIALGKEEIAHGYATKAIDILPKGSPYWLRAQDIRLSSDKKNKD